MRLGGIIVLIICIIGLALMTSAQNDDPAPPMMTQTGVVPILQTRQAQLPPFLQTEEALRGDPPPVQTSIARQTARPTDAPQVIPPQAAQAQPSATPTLAPSPAVFFVAPTATPPIEQRHIWRLILRYIQTSITGE